MHLQLKNLNKNNSLKQLIEKKHFFNYIFITYIGQFEEI